ncbi:MAG: hypothetical protein G01um101472_264 [Parcubacteria group bacterium Gr01-1014_72]|nr:MAG: hypothetical protein G01um101472_264 [Parcubacteria group bacterium Gr01-1014_72]
MKKESKRFKQWTYPKFNSRGLTRWQWMWQGRVRCGILLPYQVTESIMRRLSFNEWVAVFVSLVIIASLFGIGRFFFPAEEAAANGSAQAR